MITLSISAISKAPPLAKSTTPEVYFKYTLVQVYVRPCMISVGNIPTEYFLRLNWNILSLKYKNNI